MRSILVVVAFLPFIHTAKAREVGAAVFENGTNEEIEYRVLKHKDSILTISGIPNKGIISVSTSSRAYYVWQVTDKKLVKAIESGREFGCYQALVSSNDVLSLAYTLMTDHLRIQNLNTGEERERDIHPFASAMSQSPNGEVIAVAFGKSRSIATYSTQNLSLRASIDLKDIPDTIRPAPKLVPGGYHAINCLCFSPDGKGLYVGSGAEAFQSVDISSGAEKAQFVGHRSGITSIAVDPSGKIVASASYDGTVRTWDTKTNLELMKFEGHSGCVQTISFLAGANSLVSGGEDKSIRLWDTMTGKERLKLKYGDGMTDAVITSVWVDEHRKLLVTGDLNGLIVIWDLSPIWKRL